MLEIRVKNEISEKLNQYIPQLTDKLVQAMGDASQLIVRSATGVYMRNAPGEPRRREKSDKGPLRIVSGRLARSFTGARKGGNNPESVFELSIGQGIIQLRTGSLVPYSAIHEFGGIAGRGAVIPARPYLTPAIEDEQENVRSVFERAIIELSTELGLD